MTPTFRDDFPPDPGAPEVLSDGSRDKAAQWWNDMLGSLLEGLGDACLVTDSRLEVIFANTEARELFRSALQPVGRRLFEVFTDHRLTEVAERSQRGRAPVEQALQIVINQGGNEQKKYLVISAAPIRLPGEPPATGLRIIIRDETHQRETEQIRKDFVANASHELRTPLSIINGYLENLVDGAIDDPLMVQRSLLTMQKHSLRLARIVEDMLTISRFESVGEHEAADLKRSTFSVEECAKDVLDRLHPVFEEKRARVEMEFPPPDVGSRLAGDRFYWDQVFFNLIENALKENHQPGLVISVGLRHLDDGGTELWVRDNGVGIPRADLPFVFKRFYRVAKHHGQEVKGTGLGLSIVRRAVEAHGGQIAVDSTPGQRTQFTITLPPPPEPAEEGVPPL
jgi:two-component system phosphate regulon sensor histidine kinase PhoR